MLRLCRPELDDLDPLLMVTSDVAPLSRARQAERDRHVGTPSFGAVEGCHFGGRDVEADLQALEFATIPRSVLYSNRPPPCRTNTTPSRAVLSGDHLAAQRI